MKKLLYITPHLSTGGMPQYLLKKIQLLKDEFDIYCIEHVLLATTYIVQREQVIKLLGDKFHTLEYCLKERMLDIIDQIQPDIIHFEEFPEIFLKREITEKIYKKDRKYLLFETYHGVYLKPEDKHFFPDKFLFVSQQQANLYGNFGVPYDIIEYPIEFKKPNQKAAQNILNFDSNYKHVINVGLFTSGKNQGELIEYAKKMQDENVIFHFIGNQAPNFEPYWGPLMKDLPKNCKIWGERSDTDLFYQAADLMVFTSKMETSPLVIREAISWNLPSLFYDLPAYTKMYDKYKSVSYLKFGDADYNIKKIKELLYI